MAKPKVSKKTRTITDSSSERVSIQKRLRARYDTHMPQKKHHRVLIWVVFFVCSTVVAAQLLYPTDRALPRARVADESVVWKNHEELATVLDTRFRSATLHVSVGETSVDVPLAAAGAEPNSERMIDHLVAYPFWLRFIPFSIVVQTPHLIEADVFYTESVLREASKKLADELSHEAVSARLAIEQGELVATPERQGAIVSPDAVYKAIVQARVTLGGATTLAVPSTHIQPSQTAQHLQAVRTAAEEALARQVTIVAGEYRVVADRSTIASWLQLTVGEDGAPRLEVADDVLTLFFDGIDTKAGTPAGRTNINLTDGRETSRTTGETGRAIDRDELRAQVKRWLLSGEGSGTFVAAFHDVLPSVIYDNKYTATEEGLRAYVADASRRMNVHIAIQQVDGAGWTASSRADESLPSASTYKLFVAKWLFDQMDKGLVHWDDPMLDTTVSVCFDRMTIASTNPCAESWLAQAGRPQFNDYIYGLGFSRGTNFNMPVATQTTANDLQRMMRGIYDGSLISGAHKERLLHSLATHPFRYGIAAGSRGHVYDKVGFLWDYVHDTAIVQHPKGTYIMTIMTKGQSYATIASLTREIERILYP